MFWAVMLFAGLALVFAQLGAMSVWMLVMSGALKLALLIIAAFVIALLWRKVFPKNSPVKQIDMSL